jgi:hypothetical protein
MNSCLQVTYGTYLIMLYMEGSDNVQFQINGEIPRSKYDALISSLGQLGVSVSFSTEFPVISPSIAMEYVANINGLSSIAVTKESVAEYLMSEGREPGVAATMSSTLMQKFDFHLYAEHGFGSNRHAHTCDCPLRGITARKLLSYNHLVGIEPGSLIAFSKIPYRDTKKYELQRYGAKSHELVAAIARRILQDMDTSANSAD